MQKVIVIILLALVDAKELAANHAGDAQDAPHSMNKLADMLAGKLADNLFDRAQKARRALLLHHAGLENTTLGKPCQPATPATPLGISLRNDLVAHQPGPCSHSMRWAGYQPQVFQGPHPSARYLLPPQATQQLPRAKTDKSLQKKSPFANKMKRRAEKRQMKQLQAVATGCLLLLLKQVQEKELEKVVGHMNLGMALGMIRGGNFLRDLGWPWGCFGAPSENILGMPLPAPSAKHQTKGLTMVELAAQEAGQAAAIAKKEFVAARALTGKDLEKAKARIQAAAESAAAAAAKAEAAAAALAAADSAAASPSVLCARASMVEKLAEKEKLADKKPVLERGSDRKQADAMTFKLPSMRTLNSSIAQLDQLSLLWEKENGAERKRSYHERRSQTLEERVQRGVALRNLKVVDEDAALGGRILLWLAPGASDELEVFGGSPGTPVRLWVDDPDSNQAVLGIVSRRENDRIGVVVDEIPDALETGGTKFQLDCDSPYSTTFARGEKAMNLFREAKEGTPLYTMREVLFGHQPVTFGTEKTGSPRPQTRLAPDKPSASKPGPFRLWLQTRQEVKAAGPGGGDKAESQGGGSLKPFDASINGPQWEAVTHALSADHLALIHGPPGTGKTRALIEVIRQAVAQGKRVLASAASNAAVDILAKHLAVAQPPNGTEKERQIRGLDPQSLQVVRLGHPARISDQIKDLSLDAQVEKTQEYKLSRKFVIEANGLRQKIANKRARGDLSKMEEQELVREMRSLFRDARSMLLMAQNQIMRRAEVVCTTAAGADAKIMGDSQFDLVVLDEATQATDPITLVACARGKKVIMAGDPCQLPPTVIDPDAAREGLGETFFERLAAQDQDALRMLTVQYRMHKAIMDFPSRNMYEGRLIAAPEVAKHQLHEIDGVASDPLRDAPFMFLDTSGMDWVGWEKKRKQDRSTFNPFQANRTVAEVLRLISRGLQPSEVAVITPYKAQVRLLRYLLSDLLAQGLEVDSVDGFQGREKEAIVFDLVRSNEHGSLGFVNDIRRLNVALTRAKRFLMVIGDSATLGLSNEINKLLEHADKKNAYLSIWNDDVHAPVFEHSH